MTQSFLNENLVELVGGGLLSRLLYVLIRPFPLLPWWKSQIRPTVGFCSQFL